MGIGICELHRNRRARVRRTHFDIIGLKMNDGCEIRDPPDRQGPRELSDRKTQGQGHETTYAQIIAEELGNPVIAHIKIEDTATRTPPRMAWERMRVPDPHRSSGAVGRRWRRARCRDKARKLAAHLLEEAEPGRPGVGANGKFSVKGSA